MFYSSILYEAIKFNIVPPLVAQDLTKYLAEFSWESFEFWFDVISVRLIAYQTTELGIGLSLSDKSVESTESSSFPLSYPQDPEKLPP